MPIRYIIYALLRHQSLGH